MIRLVEAANNDLKAINSSEELNNSTILSIIEGRMNPKMQNEWIQLAVKTTLSDKFAKLLFFLDNWKIRIEYENSEIRSPSKKVADHNVHSKQPEENRKRSCLIHTNCEHPIWRCRTFKSLSVSERLNIIKSNNACLLCLEVGHTDHECKKVSKCSRSGCNLRHNVLLHDDQGC